MFMFMFIIFLHYLQIIVQQVSTYSKETKIKNSIAQVEKRKMCAVTKVAKLSSWSLPQTINWHEHVHYRKKI